MSKVSLCSVLYGVLLEETQLRIVYLHQHRVQINGKFDFGIIEKWRKLLYN